MKDEKCIETIERRIEERERQYEEQDQAIGKFIPCMMHSFGEKSQPIGFHESTIDDWNNVLQISEKFLKMLTE
jgi:hypothetical protein